MEPRRGGGLGVRERKVAHVERPLGRDPGPPGGPEEQLPRRLRHPLGPGGDDRVEAVQDAGPGEVVAHPLLGPGVRDHAPAEPQGLDLLQASPGIGEEPEVPGRRFHLPEELGRRLRGDLALRGPGQHAPPELLEGRPARGDVGRALHLLVRMAQVVGIDPNARLGGQLDPEVELPLLQERAAQIEEDDVDPARGPPGLPRTGQRTRAINRPAGPAPSRGPALRDPPQPHRGRIHGRGGVAEVHRGEGVHQDPGDHEVAVPLVVGGDEVPRGPRRARPPEHLGVGGLVVVPERPFVEVRLAELPVLRRVVDPLLEAPPLFLGAHVEEELQHRRALVDELALEGVDRAEPGRPDRRGHEAMDPGRQDILVVAAVEDHDLPLAGRPPVDPPEEIVGLLLRGGGPERAHAHPLGVHPLEDVPDDPVLPAGVHPLEDHEEPPATVGVEQLLQPVQLGPQPFQRLVGALLAPRPMRRAGGVGTPEPDATTGGDPERSEPPLHGVPGPADGGVPGPAGPRGGRLDCPRISGRRPWAARIAGSSPPGPRRMWAIPTAIIAPTSGPATYTQAWPRFPSTMSGPRDRAGFMDAPLTGAAQRPARPMYPPTANAARVPTLWAREAVPRIVLTRPTVRTTSMENACRSVMPGPGSVAPRPPTRPKRAARNAAAPMAPISWATMYPGTRFHGKSPRAANAMLTAGLRWAPEVAPMNRMMAITMRPGATTSPAGLRWLPVAALTTGPPAAASTRRNVPNASANSRRPSSAGSRNSRCTASSVFAPGPAEGRTGPPGATAATIRPPRGTAGCGPVGKAGRPGRFEGPGTPALGPSTTGA